LFFIEKKVAGWLKEIQYIKTNVWYVAGQSYEMKLKRLKEGSDADEKLLKVFFICYCYYL